MLSKLVFKLIISDTNNDTVLPHLNQTCEQVSRIAKSSFRTKALRVQSSRTDEPTVASPVLDLSRKHTPLARTNHSVYGSNGSDTEEG